MNNEKSNSLPQNALEFYCNQARNVYSQIQMHSLNISTGALISVLIDKGVITSEEYDKALEAEDSKVEYALENEDIERASNMLNKCTHLIYEKKYDELSRMAKEARTPKPFDALLGLDDDDDDDTLLELDENKVPNSVVKWSNNHDK